MRRLLAIVLVGCGSSSAPVDPAQPAADPAPCADVAAHEVQVMNLGFLGDQKTGAMKLKLEARCRDDSWGGEARRCVLTATGFDEMSACQDKLSSAQRAAYQHEIRGSGEAEVEGSGAPPPPPELLK
jgi:hypothetical protein